MGKDEGYIGVAQDQGVIAHVGRSHAVSGPIVRKKREVVSVSPCQTAYKVRNKRQMKIRGLHEDGRKIKLKGTFEVWHRPFGTSRLHSSLLCTF